MRNVYFLGLEPPWNRDGPQNKELDLIRLKTKPMVLFAAGMAMAFTPAWAQPQAETVKPENGAYLLWSMGELMESREPKSTDPARTGEIWNNEWIYELVGGLMISSSPVDRLRLTVNFEIASYNVYPRKPGAYDGEPTQDTKFSTYIEEAKGVFTFGKKAPTAFEFEFGYFLTRYNKSARVFGEYLFRTMVYPSIIFNNFDYPWSPISGVRIGHEVTENLHHNLYILSETDHYPYFDFSIAYEAGYNLANVLEIGGGVNFQRIIPVRPSLTSPDHIENIYVKIPAQAAVLKLDSSGAVIDTIEIDTPQEGFLQGRNVRREVDRSLKDPNNPNQLLPGIQADSTAYSFQGIIPMARIALHPLGWMDNPSLAKLVSMYSEIALLGVKDYPGLYENRKERMPVMAGLQFSLPGIIDVLAFEVEHFGSKSIPSFYYRGRSNLPLTGAKTDLNPNDTSEAGRAAMDKETRRLSRDDWKFILYARKQFKGLAVTMQVGTDHMRREIEEVGVRYDEILTTPSQWYWQVRIRIPY